MRNWRLRTKLAAVLAVPTITALALGGLNVYDELHQAARLRQTEHQVDFATKVSSLVDELQQERALAVVRAATGDPGRQPALDTEIAKVDRWVDDVRASADSLNPGDAAEKERYRQGLQALDVLRPLRSAVGSNHYSDFATLAEYSLTIDSLVQLGREITISVSDRDLLRQSAATQAVSEAKEFFSRADAALEMAAVRQDFPGDLLQQATDAEASGTAAVDSFTFSATPQQQQLYSDTVSGPEIDGRNRIRTVAFSQAEDKLPPQIDQAALTTDASVELDKLHAVETSLLGDIKARASDLAATATNAAWRDAGIVVGALVLAFVLMLAIARLMLRPLTVLRKTADDIATTRLPLTVRAILQDPDPMNASTNVVPPVPIASTEEVGEVARSFDKVHEQAVRMAAEQALLRENVNGIFVNLSRRSQRLVERQLGVIDRLEADEQDPDHLASLFELDHLATRLRRNGESLLVLSGAGLAKSVSKPVHAADVIGAAVSEIEQYARVEVGVVPDVAVQGPTVHDLVHLLAELLDNATYFSEPETKITVRAVITRKKALAVQITDRGVGMSEEQLVEANQRLADPPDLDVSVTRRMGLYVVAQLARRHGIEVRLRENEDIEGGVIARIVVPAQLLTTLRPDTRLTPPPPSRSETSISLPSIELPAARTSSSPPAVVPPVTAHTPPGNPPAAAPGGLTPLDQPISLDDLTHGSSAAGPFLSPAWPETERDAGPTGGGSSAGEAPFPPLVLPKREPQYVPVVPPDPPAPPVRDGEGSLGSALEDDVPTKRLPIYQSVLSRWFSECEDDASLAEAQAQAQADLDAAARARLDATPAAGDDASGWPDDSDIPIPGDAEEAVGGKSGAGEEEPIAAPTVAVDDGWHSASDEGWRAAHALLEPKNEEITPAGLPKRVPNAYLVPGSINGGDQPAAYRGTASGLPGQSAIARSASEARTRMASFQRGFTSGRHALRDRSAEVPVQEGVSVAGGSMGFPSDDSGEE